MQKPVNLVDLVKSFPTNIYLQNLASIQKRTSPIKVAHLAEKSGKGSISNLSTKVLTSRTFAQQASAYIKDDQLCDKMVRYVIATVVATRCHLRNLKVDPTMLLGVLSKKEIEILNQQKNMPFYTTFIVRNALAEAISIGSCLPLQVARGGCLVKSLTILTMLFENNNNIV